MTKEYHYIHGGRVARLVASGKLVQFFIGHEFLHSFLSFEEAFKELADDSYWPPDDNTDSSSPSEWFVPPKTSDWKAGKPS
jgi:hypothetical protein